MSAVAECAEKTIPQSYWENAEWSRQHATDLHEQYEGKWIAIADGQVVAVGNSPVGVRRRAARQTGHATEEIFVEFIEFAGAIYGANWTLV